MATKNVASQSLKKGTGSLFRRSYQASTIPSRQVHGMKTRSRVRIIVTKVVSQMTSSLPKHQDLQQKMYVG